MATPAPDAYWKGVMHGTVVALTCLMLWALCCCCRGKGSNAIFCRDVSTMSYDPVRGCEGDAEVKELYLKGGAGHGHSD